jgi:Yip1-like protein
MASATLQQAPEAPERVNPFTRIVGVIFSPKETFASIARRPTWLVPTVLLCLCTLGVVAAFGSRPNAWRAYLERQLDSSSRFQQLSQQQQQQALNAQLKYAPIFAYPEVILADFLVVVIIASIYWGIFSVGAGIKVSFKTSLGITAHAWMPFVLSGLLAIVVVLLKDPADVDLNNPLAADVGAFLPTGTAKWLVAMCHSLDIFSIWVLCLFALGFSAVNPKKLKFGAALVWVVAIWFVYVLAKGGLTAAFS